MKIDYILKQLILLLSNHNIGDEFPSIKYLSDTWECSRGIIQSSIQLLEENGAVTLEKSKSGTKIIDLNLNCLRQIFFYNDLKVALPTDILNNENNFYILNSITQDFSCIQASLFTTFDHSSYHKLENLIIKKVHMILITDTYFDLIERNNLSIIKSYPILNSTKFSYIFNTNNEGQTIVEEQTTSFQSQYSTNSSSHIKLLKPTQYHVVSLKETYNLLKV